MENICVGCKEKCGVLFDITTFKNGDKVCINCLNSYLESKKDEFVDEFIDENEQDYLNFWWEECIDKKRKLLHIKKAYQNEIGLQKKLGDKSEERYKEDFLYQNEQFYDYIIKRL